MEQYKLIDMFDKLDTSILEELHLEKDLKRHKNRVKRLFTKGYVKVASIAAGSGLAVTGVLFVIVRMKIRRFQRRVI